jgi:hypothetical protein
MPNRISILLILFMGIFTVQLSAQNEDMLLPSEVKQLTAVTEPATLNKGFFRIGTYWFYVQTKKVYNDYGVKQFVPSSLISKFSNLNFHAQYGISDRVQLTVNLPYHMDISQDIFFYIDPISRSSTQFIIEQKGYGLGDISSDLGFKVLKESAILPSVTLFTSVKLPTGRRVASNFSADSMAYSTPTGSGEFSLNAALYLKKIYYPYSIAIYTSYQYNFGGQKIIYPNSSLSSFRTGNSYSGSASISFHLNDWISLKNELSYYYVASGHIDGILDMPVWKLEYEPSIYFQIKQFRLAQGIGIPLAGIGSNADPLYRITAQFVF